MKDILRGSFVIFMFKVLGAGSLLLTSILISRYYSVELFGVFNLIFALMVITAVIARVGLDTYVLRVISSSENNMHEISLFLKEVFKIIFLGSLIVTIMILFFQ